MNKLKESAVVQVITLENWAYWSKIWWDVGFRKWFSLPQRLEERRRVRMRLSGDQRSQ